MAIKNFLQTEAQKTMLRFLTCGSVDDGKSTLIGRLLFDSGAILDDQLQAIQDTQNDEQVIHFANLVDGLQSEREQGITIDVAYRYFDTKTRKYIIIDTPGHEQYTRNMATGASNADVAILLIDATKGVREQTKRHSFIAALLGIRQIFIAVNKMDLVDFSQEVFAMIQKDYLDILPSLPNSEELQISFVPICATSGDNVVNASTRCGWYQGATLMELLEKTNIYKNTNTSFALSIQSVLKNSSFRGFCGEIASGEICVGDEVSILPSHKKTKIKSILTSDIDPNSSQKWHNQTSQIAFAPMSVVLCLQDEIDISRGDVLIKSGTSLQVAKDFKVMLVWMSEKPLEPFKSYIIKRATFSSTVVFSTITYKYEINTLTQMEPSELHLNDIAQCQMQIEESMAFCSYEENKTLGGFIVIDKYSNETVSMGMIIDASQAKPQREYTKEDKNLNALIRSKYPEWECKKI